MKSIGGNLLPEHAALAALRLSQAVQIESSSGSPYEKICWAILSLVGKQAAH